jgi:hypothetical protein
MKEEHMRHLPPPDFDWVTARAQCSAEAMFRTLAGMARKNVETRNAQIPTAVRFVEEADRHFGVEHATTSFNRAAVYFRVDSYEDRLTVDIHGVETKEWELRFLLDRDGVCRAEMGGERLEPWQVLQKLLEPVLFPRRR